MKQQLWLDKGGGNTCAVTKGQNGAKIIVEFRV